MKDVPLLLLFLLLLIKMSNAVSAGITCQEVEQSTLRHSSSINGTNPNFICINGISGPSIWAVWSDVKLNAKAKDKLKFISGKSCQEVVDKYANRSSLWNPMSWFFSRNIGERKSVTVSPYGKNCFAIFLHDESASLNIALEVTGRNFNPLYPILMVVGMLIFFNAEDISRNVLFYYTSGVSIGMILSILLLVLIISRVIPKRSASYAFLFSGTSFVLYGLQHCWDNLSSKALEHNKIFIGYCIVTGLTSFLYCYYRGPVTNERGIDIMRWSLQALGLFLVYYSIRCAQISLTVVLILVAFRWMSLRQIFCYLITRGWVPFRLHSLFLKPKLITLEEYETEGQEETVRALKELQEYCESPDCNTWQTVSRLKSPKRFAAFMSHGVHLTDDELTEYENTSFEAAPFLTSDEDSDVELAAINLDFDEQAPS